MSLSDIASKYALTGAGTYRILTGEEEAREYDMNDVIFNIDKKNKQIIATLPAVSELPIQRIKDRQNAGR